MCQPRNRNSRIKFALASLLFLTTFSSWVMASTFGALESPLNALALVTTVFILVLDCFPSTFEHIRAYYAWSFLAILQFFLLVADSNLAAFTIINAAHDRDSYQVWFFMMPRRSLDQALFHFLGCLLIPS